MDRRALSILVIATLASPLFAAELNVEQAPAPKVVPAKEIKWVKDLEKGQAAMKRNNRPMFLYVTAPGCLYCDQMKQSVFTQKFFVDELNRKYTPVEINGREHKSISDRLQIKMFPAIAIVHPSGKVVEIARGYRTSPELLKHLAIAKARMVNHEKQIAAKSPQPRVNSTKTFQVGVR